MSDKQTGDGLGSHTGGNSVVPGVVANANTAEHGSAEQQFASLSDNGQNQALSTRGGSKLA